MLLSFVPLISVLSWANIDLFKVRPVTLVFEPSSVYGNREGYASALMVTSLDKGNVFWKSPVWRSGVVQNISMLPRCLGCISTCFWLATFYILCFGFQWSTDVLFGTATSGLTWSKWKSLAANLGVMAGWQGCKSWSRQGSNRDMLFVIHFVRFVIDLSLTVPGSTWPAWALWSAWWMAWWVVRRESLQWFWWIYWAMMDGLLHLQSASLLQAIWWQLILNETINLW